MKPAHLTATERTILDAQPLDLARLLCSPATLHALQGGDNVSRSFLRAACAALGNPSEGEAPDVPGALYALRCAMARAIQPHQVEQRAETVLLQAAFWLLATQAKFDDVAAVYAGAVDAAQVKH